MYVMPDGVLCAHVAARPAVPAMPAGVLHHACNVRSRTVGDRHRRQLHRTARRFRRPAHAGKLGKALRAGHRRDTEHRLRPRQSLQQESIADHRIRPTGLAQSAEIGPKHDAGVDQRPAAEAGCAEHGQPLADRQVVEPGRIAQLRRAARQPQSSCAVPWPSSENRRAANAAPARGPPSADPCARGGMLRHRRRSRNR